MTIMLFARSLWYEICILVCLTLSALVFALQGCKTKEEKAASKALVSAKQGAALAQFKLGKRYASGEGVVEDMVYAYMWVNFADSQGLGSTTSEYKSKLVKLMTLSQIETAEKLTVECKQKAYKNC